MFMTHPYDAQVFAAEHVRRLHDDASVIGLARRHRVRCAVAASLRSVANRLDSRPLALRAA
jgi:hypothetical protein